MVVDRENKKARILYAFQIIPANSNILRSLMHNGSRGNVFVGNNFLFLLQSQPKEGFRTLFSRGIPEIMVRNHVY